MTTEYRTDRVTLLALHRRKPGLSIEEFRQFWRNHAEVFMSMDIAKKRLLKYEQLHPNAKQLEGLPSVLPYDGAVIFQAETYDDIMQIFQSQEYKDQVVPDEERFVDRNSVAMLPCDMLTVVSK